MYSTTNRGNEISKFIKKYPLIFKKFRVLKHLSKGAFSDIYIGINKLTKEKVAIKVEGRYEIDKCLETECFFLFSLRGFGIPKVISFGHNKEYDILVMPLLGKSLHEIQMSKNFNFEFKDICLIAIQIIERIEWVHSQKIIHRDIKPDNFLIGLNDPNVIYLIDFGLSKKYRSSITGNHIKNTQIKKFVGSLRYASVNALRIREQSRKDDLESIGYMLIYLIKRRLPWDNIKVDNKRSSYLKLSNYKKNIEPELLCENLPDEFAEYIRYVKNLNFEDEPDYNYLKSLFQIMLNKQGFEEDKIFFSWINESNIFKLKKSINLSKRSSSSRGRIFKKIKKTIDSKRSKSEINNRNSSENYNEIDDNKYSYHLNQNKNKKNLEDNGEDIKYKKNYESKPIINNYIYSYITPQNNININNQLYHNQYKFNFISYNPFVMKPNENKNDKKPNINFNYMQSPARQNNLNYNPVITYNKEINDYNIKKKSANYQPKIKNQNYYNNNIIKLNNINKSYGPNNLLNQSYPNKIGKNYYYFQKSPQNNDNNKYNKDPLSYLDANTDIKIIDIKKPSGVKNFNLWNISPFKKRKNNVIINNKNNNIKMINNNINNSQLINQTQKFNKKYNINIRKDDKFLIKNKVKKINLSHYLTSNKSTDNNKKLMEFKNKFKYQGNNTDKNCIII